MQKVQTKQIDIFIYKKKENYDFMQLTNLREREREKEWSYFINYTEFTVNFTHDSPGHYNKSTSSNSFRNSIRPLLHSRNYFIARHGV